jgi:23S rRNA pseudouridine1911/1915/1917 synthase
MPRTEWGWLITSEELPSWILEQSDDLLVINKPAHVVCHPSKHGPWSSLVGACREYLGTDRLHLTFRLDRETSGVVVFALNRTVASLLQKAIERRHMNKTYLAILDGVLPKALTVDAPIGPDPDSEFVARQWTVANGRTARTEFIPLAATGEYTLAKIHPLTGRRHQIRVHAASLGCPVLGDKLYGPDPALMPEFIEKGFTPEMQRKLKLSRHALHAFEIEFPTVLEATLIAPLPPELEAFWEAAQSPAASGHSHSIVPGGLLVTS